MNDLNENNEANFISLFPTPLMEVQLDLDVEKLTELAFEIMNRDKRGKQISNIGGWQSDIILEENQEEFDVASRGMDWALLVLHIDQFIRNKIKYEQDREDILQLVRNELTFQMEERGLNYPE